MTTTHNTLMTVLAAALTTKRPHGGTGDARFAAYLATQFGGATLIDGHGNLHFDRRSAGERTMFTSHTDTVHHTDGRNKVRIDGNFWRAEGDVLGADDGAGIALMAHMMEAGVPGYYVFFRGEECGGLGSTWLADNMTDLLREFDRAVAFDRAGYYDVITHQSGGRCCSDEFADALATQLADAGLLFAPCDSGVYTDTAEFTHDIPECTNLSVGYKAQHSNREEQDVAFLRDLADALVKVNWEQLPTKRDPHARPERQIRGLDDYALRYYDREAERYETPPQLEGPERALADIIEVAMDTLNTKPLMDLVALLLWPENPAGIRMDAKRLTEDTLFDALACLNSGFSAEEIAQDLFDAAFTQ